MHKAKTSAIPKFITSLLAVFALVLGGSIASVTPAQAITQGCISSGFQPSGCSTKLTDIVTSTAANTNVSTGTATASCGTATFVLKEIVPAGNKFDLVAVVHALPAGLAMTTPTANTAVVSGIPTATTAATYSYAIVATCGASDEAFTFSVTVTATATAIILPTLQTIDGVTGQAITPSAAFSASNFTGSVSYAVAPALPASLTMSATTGVISGTPDAVQTATSYTITATGATSGTATSTVTITVTAPAAAPVAEPEPVSRKVTICHRTHATTNPYVRITVDYNSVNKKSGHREHDEIFAGEHVFKAGIYKRAKDKDWGDIIPADSSGLNRWQPLNWTLLGAQIYSGAVAGCPSYDPVAYYNAQREAGVPEAKLKKEMSDIETELQEGNPGTKRVDPNTLKYTGSNAAVAEQENDKVTICHRTNSTTNPYRKITVSTSSVTNKAGHMSHDEIYDGHHVFDSTVSYPNNKKDWGDIIPADPTGKNRWQPLNWTTLGQAIYAGTVAGCAEKSVQEIYNELRESGKPKKEIIKDLEEQSSVDDDPKDIDEVQYTGTDPKTEETEPREPKDPNPKAIDQSLSGIVWLDLNKDGLKDANEPLMKGITLSVVQVTSVTPTRVSGNLRTMAMRSGVGVRPAAVVTIQTDANGYYVFPSLGAGDWKVVTGVPDDLYVTYDSHESSDGVITATVPVGSHAFTWVGLVSDEETTVNKYLEEILKENPTALPTSEIPTWLQKELKAIADAKVPPVKKPATKGPKELAYTGTNDLYLLVVGLLLTISGAVSLRLARTKRRNARN